VGGGKKETMPRPTISYLKNGDQVKKRMSNQKTQPEGWEWKETIGKTCMASKALVGEAGDKKARFIRGENVQKTLPFAL